MTGESWRKDNGLGNDQRDTLSTLQLMQPLKVSP